MQFSIFADYVTFVKVIDYMNHIDSRFRIPII